MMRNRAFVAGVAGLIAAAFLSSCSFFEDPNNPGEPVELLVDPPPSPEAQVVMTNSKGEVLVQGKTDSTGRLQGERGPGQVDQIIYVDATLADGFKVHHRIRVPDGYRLVSLRINVRDGKYYGEYQPVGIAPKTEVRGGEDSDDHGP